MRVVAWGTFDTGKPRVRILLKGLTQNDVEVVECHQDVWGDIEDKSQIKGVKRKIGKALRWIASYPILLWNYAKLPKHDILFISYMGQLDILIIWPLAKLRGTPIVWDAFLSLYNTVVEDRKLISRRNPLAWGLYVWEWLACKAADVIILDTQAHGDYFVGTFSLPSSKVKSVFVGVETEKFPPRSDNFNHQHCHESKPTTILFYGQFIPLHGIETIIKAARLARNDKINWVIIGKGQEEDLIQKLVLEVPLPLLQWIPWVQYQELISHIHQADICLGIFGDTEKAARVIPNKVFQIISSGMPLITMDSPAIREIFDDNTIGVKLVKAANSQALYNGIIDLLADIPLYQSNLYQQIVGKINPCELGKELKNIMLAEVK